MEESDKIPIEPRVSSFARDAATIWTRFYAGIADGRSLMRLAGKVALISGSNYEVDGGISSKGEQPQD